MVLRLHHAAETFGDFVKTQVSDTNTMSLILRYRVKLENLHPNEFHDAAGIPGAEIPLLEFKSIYVKCAFFSVCLSRPNNPPLLTYQWHQRKPVSLNFNSGPHHKKKMILLPQSHLGPRFLLPYSCQHFAVLHGCWSPKTMYLQGKCLE